MPGILLERAISGACGSALSIFLPLDELYIRHVVFSDREQFCDKNKFPFNLYFEDKFVIGVCLGLNTKLYVITRL